MDDDENEEIFDCPICLINYRNPKLLSCSHTICEICLKDIIKKHPDNPLCPICNTPIVIKVVIDNNKIIESMFFCNSMNNYADNFLKFPLKFKYCSDCKIFITNYSFYKHKKQKHNLFSYDSVLQSFFEKKENAFDKDILFILYFYLNPFLHEIKYIDKNANSLELCNNKYILFRKILDHKYENNFLIRLMKEKYFEPENGRLFKGLLINKKKLFFIQGLFFIKSKSGDPLIQPTIFGLLNYENIKFFGFIKLNKEYISRNEEFEIKDIIFECGLLYNVNYYFGKFNNINLSNIISQNVNLNLLKAGEILIPKENNNIEVKSIIVKYTKKEQKTEDLIKFNVDPFYIQENNSLDDYKILNCKIILTDYDRTLFFDKDNYAMYIKKTKNDKENNSENNNKNDKVLYLYYTQDTNNISQYIMLINYHINEIKEEKTKGQNDFNELLKGVLKIKVEKCKIYYYECHINSGEIKLNENKYFEISGNKATVKNGKYDGIQYEDSNLNNVRTIEDLLKIELTSDIYNFQDKKRKNEEISCKCNII